VVAEGFEDFALPVNLVDRYQYFTGTVGTYLPNYTEYRNLDATSCDNLKPYIRFSILIFFFIILTFRHVYGLY